MYLRGEIKMASSGIHRYEQNNLNSEKRHGYSQDNNKTPKNFAHNRGRHSLPEPSSFSNFVVLIVINLCRKILFWNTAVVIGYFIVLVIMGSMITDIVPMPRTYFSNKRNFLNMYFVKLGWGWTLSILGSFVGMTSYTYTCGKVKLSMWHLSRLGVATVWWYIITHTLVFIQDVTSHCSDSHIHDRTSCLQAGKSWAGFDISGHAFLLIHSILTISEEVKVFKDWIRLDDLLKRDSIAGVKNLSNNDVNVAGTLYKTLTPYIKFAFFLLTLLFLLWHLMLFFTVVYRFHTMIQKVIGCFVAIVCWFVSYQVLFTLKIPFLPPPAGESPLRYTRVQYNKF